MACLRLFSVQQTGNFVFFEQDFGPAGTEVNSRGRAALREAHGIRVVLC